MQLIVCKLSKHYVKIVKDHIGASENLFHSLKSLVSSKEE